MDGLIKLRRIYRNVQENYPSNTIRKNHFLTFCTMLDMGQNLDEINDLCPFGGNIGMGNSRLEHFLNPFKIIRLHAIMHDASGFMRHQYGVGPGYCYAFPYSPINSCFLGHVTGLIYCIYLKFLYPVHYRLLAC